MDRPAGRRPVAPRARGVGDAQREHAHLRRLAGAQDNLLPGLELAVRRADPVHCREDHDPHAGLGVLK